MSETVNAQKQAHGNCNNVCTLFSSNFDENSKLWRKAVHDLQANLAWHWDVKGD
jgi:hypothetical protein